MTVANETARTSATGTAAALQEIAFLFPINATSEIVVKTRVTATGVEATLTETTHYTVAISGDVGGTVTLVDALAATSTVHIIRDTPNTQSLDLEQGGTFSAENIEDALDKNARIGADNNDAISRSIRAPSTDPTTVDMELPSSVDRASNWLYFDADGQPTVSAAVAPSTATITAYAETILAAATAAAARTVLELAPGTNVQAWDAQLDKIAALATTNSAMIVGDGTNFVLESGATLLTSIGAPATATVILKDGSVAYTATGVGFTDEDDMHSNLPLAPPSEQSVAAFLYSVVTYDGDVLSHNGEILTYV